jgi:alpha-beta hydrolase superfamily lysophospholipase
LLLRRQESAFSSSDGLSLFRRSWLPERTTRALLVVHGFGEHSGRYDELAAWFADRGCAVHAFDLRGHGRSAGTRTHVDDFEDYLADVERLHELVRDEHPELPLTLLGHSMGGLIGLAYLAARRRAPTSAVISAPALLPDRAVSRGRRLLARTLQRLAPRLAMTSGLDPTGLSRDEEVVRRYVNDPLVVRTMTAGLGGALLSAAPALRARAREIEVPVLLLHGAADPICPVAGSEEIAKELTAAGSALRVYPELRHEIFNEPERHRVFADAWEWIEGLSR